MSRGHRRTRVWPLLIASLVLGLVEGASASTSHLDRTFGHSGVVTTDFGPQRQAYLGGVIATSRGLVATGAVGWPFFEQAFGVARYLPDGRLDPAFGRAGRSVVTIPGTAEYLGVPPPSPLDQVLRGGVPAVGAGMTGRETVGGSLTFGGVLWPVVVLASEPAELVATRLHPDGTVDRGYGRDGVVVLPLAPFVLFAAYTANLGIHVDADGSLLGAMWSYTLPPCGFAVPCAPPISYLTFVRLTPAGALDTRFGAGGVLVMPTPEGWTYDAMAVLTNGHVVVGGNDGVQGILRSYAPDGTPDVLFGTGGLVVLDATDQRLSWVNALAAAPHGDVLVAAGSEALRSLLVSSGREEVRRLDSHGAGVPGFGRNGLVVLPAGGRVTTAATDGQRLVLGREAWIKQRFCVDVVVLDVLRGRRQWSSGPLPCDANVFAPSALVSGRRVVLAATWEGGALRFRLYALHA